MCAGRVCSAWVSSYKRVYDVMWRWSAGYTGTLHVSEDGPRSVLPDQVLIASVLVQSLLSKPGIALQVVCCWAM